MIQYMEKNELHEKIEANETYQNFKDHLLFDYKTIDKKSQEHFLYCLEKIDEGDVLPWNTEMLKFGLCVYRDKHLSGYGKYYDDISPYNNYKIAKYDDYKIPKITHHYWLTDPNNPKEIATKEFAFLDRIFDSKSSPVMGDDWKHIFWINTDKIPESLERLKKYKGIEFKNIFEDKALKHTDLVKKFINNDTGVKAIGMAVDLLKYDILNEYGGLALDLNSVIFGHLDHYFHNYNFIINSTAIRIENNIIASTKGHIIIREMLNLIDQQQNNIFNELNNARDELKEYQASVVTNKYTYYPLLGMYYKYANLENNCDIVMPPRDNITDSRRYHKIVDDIVDHSCVNYTASEYFKLSDYVKNTCIIGMSGIGYDDALGGSWNH